MTQLFYNTVFSEHDRFIGVGQNNGNSASPLFRLTPIESKINSLLIHT